LTAHLTCSRRVTSKAPRVSEKSGESTSGDRRSVWKPPTWLAQLYKEEAGSRFQNLALSLQTDPPEQLFQAKGQKKSFPDCKADEGKKWNRDIKKSSPGGTGSRREKVQLKKPQKELKEGRGRNPSPNQQKKRGKEKRIHVP